MLAAAISREKPFDVVLVDDTSRISRTLKDSFTIHDELRFAGVRLIFVSQGIDTDSEQAEVLLATPMLRLPQRADRGRDADRPAWQAVDYRRAPRGARGSGGHSP